MFARINVPTPATTMAALSLAIDFLRTERDAAESFKDATGAERAERMRDSLGALYQSLATAQMRAAVPLPRAGKRWTAEEDATLRACWGSARRAAGGSEEALQGLADAVGRTPVSVALRLQSLGIWH